MNNEEIMKTIRWYREDKDITTKEMAYLLGYNPSKYSKLEHGKQVLSAEDLYKITKILNISSDEIFKGIKKKK